MSKNPSRSKTPRCVRLPGRKTIRVEARPSAARAWALVGTGATAALLKAQEERRIGALTRSHAMRRMSRAMQEAYRGGTKPPSCPTSRVRDTLRAGESIHEERGSHQPGHRSHRRILARRQLSFGRPDLPDGQPAPASASEARARQAAAPRPLGHDARTQLHLRAPE